METSRPTPIWQGHVNLPTGKSNQASTVKNGVTGCDEFDRPFFVSQVGPAEDEMGAAGGAGVVMDAGAMLAIATWPSWREKLGLWAARKGNWLKYEVSDFQHLSIMKPYKTHELSMDMTSLKRMF